MLNLAESVEVRPAFVSKMKDQISGFLRTILGSSAQWHTVAKKLDHEPVEDREETRALEVKQLRRDGDVPAGADAAA